MNKDEAGAISTVTGEQLAVVLSVIGAAIAATPNFDYSKFKKELLITRQNPQLSDFQKQILDRVISN